MIFAQARTAVRTQDVTSAIDQVLALVPTGMRIVGFLVLAMLVLKAAREWKKLGIMELAAIVIAFGVISK